jgi:eukaryotic-like serine/threonine-protein kinase
VSRPPPDLSLLGQVLDGRYRIESLLGHGGMGAVYRAHHVHLDQRVAIKILRPHLAGDATAARRFAREAKGTFALDTEHAVRVADFGVTGGGLLYMVMEYLDGRTVHTELGVDGPMAPARAVRIAAQVCDALAAAHRLGFVHRDIKPENVMLVRRGADADFVKVLDFGLAKLIEGAAGGALSVAALTQNDMVFGTPEYMAPEQAMGHALDGRADLYAVGATLFEMLTGRPPFVDAAPMKLLALHVKAAPPALRVVAPDLSVPDALEGLVARCLAKTPEGRPGSAAELAAALRALEPQLSSVATRVPAALASSATVDLDTPSPDLSGALTVIAPRPAATAGTDVISTRGLRRSTRTLLVLLGAGGLGAAAVIAFALTRGRSREPAEPSAAALIDAHIEAAAVDAAVALAPADAAAAPDAHAAVTGVSDGRTKKPEATKVEPKVDEELAAHLAAAERARKAGNRLRQLAEADAALARDPRHVRARFLMGEALLETGDATNGCRYLRSAKRVSEARALLTSGRCPAD